MFRNLKYLKYYSKILLNNWTVVKESYAQHKEDLLLESLFPNGVCSFIDIGANDGVLFSNTYKFAKLGAKGLCIEPSPKTFQKLRLNHLFNRKVKCLNIGISYKSEVLYLIEDGYENVLSRMSQKEERKGIKINCKSMVDLLSKYSQYKHADVVSIDVEGFEGKVLEGAKNSLSNCKVIVIEIDKVKLTEMLGSKAFLSHKPAFTNDVNMILINEGFNIPETFILPSGFKRLID